uniref:GNAT family N-acetyltransferase n=1 Tax=Paenibacillus kobensis TaxID=59841 RepID=UPI000FD821E3|nr:GNAT family N-acetyltransferase [Paenibacillus kobensis]
MVRDSWVLRFAEGYSKRANSIVPLYAADTGIQLDEAIAGCETLYRSQGLRSAFKMSPIAQPSELDEMLESQGYRLVDRCSVQTLALTADLKKPQLRHIVVFPLVTEEWLEHYCRLSRASLDQKGTMFRMLSNIRTQSGFFLLHDDDETVVACGIGVIVRNYIGLWDIVTDSNYRQRGFGEQLVLHLLNWGRDNGATDSFLVVVASNAPARKLYAKLGFEHVYEHWYRVKEQGC